MFRKPGEFINGVLSLRLQVPLFPKQSEPSEIDVLSPLANVLGKDSFLLHPNFCKHTYGSRINRHGGGMDPMQLQSLKAERDDLPCPPFRFVSSGNNCNYTNECVRCKIFLPIGNNGE
jgi:hypothetical protein